MIESQFVVVKYIMRAHAQEGYESFSIVGKKGNGKTIFSVKVMTQVFMALGYGEDDAYRMALRHLLFGKKQIVDWLQFNSGKHRPVVTADDVRAHLSGMSYVTEPRETQAFLACMDTARDSASSFLMTSPSVKGLLSFLKTEEGYLVRIHKSRIANWREAKGYIRFEIPSGTMRISPRFLDSFHKNVPDDIYEQIKAKRMKYKTQVIEDLQRRIAHAGPVTAQRYQSELNEIAPMLTDNVDVEEVEGGDLNEI